MAVNFTQGSFNTGIQRQITLINNTTNLPVPYGGNLVEFESSPKVTKITVKPIDNGGYDQYKRTYDGWEGKFTVARVNGDLDALQAAQELNYHNAGAQQYYTIDETTFNDDGSVNIYQYQFCVIELNSAGAWKKDADVQLVVDFESQARVQIQ